MSRVRWHAVIAFAALTAIGVDAAVLPAGADVTIPFREEFDIDASVLTASMTNCLFASQRIGGIETCWFSFGPFLVPGACWRHVNNFPSNILEATTTAYHFSALTLAGAIDIAAWFGPSQALTPSLPMTRAVGRTGTDGSGSYFAYAHTQWLPIESYVAASIAAELTIPGTGCIPPQLMATPRQGYIYLSELDGPAWRTPYVSQYWYHPLTAAVTAMAKSVESSGSCSWDFSNFYCFGGYCSTVPGDGFSTTTSPTLGLLCAMWRAQEITNPGPTYGIYGWGLGPVALTPPLHNPAQLLLSVPPFLPGEAGPPKFSFGSYIQWLYPGSAGPAGPSDSFCYILGPPGAGSATPFNPIGGVVPGSEQLSNRQYMLPPVLAGSADWTLSFIYWPRFTCCNTCIGSTETTANLFIPERSFIPALSRSP